MTGYCGYNWLLAGYEAPCYRLLALSFTFVQGRPVRAVFGWPIGQIAREMHETFGTVYSCVPTVFGIV